MSKKHNFEILVKPVVTEKSLKLVDEENQYTFEVDSRASKDSVKQEVEKRFKVNVLKVRTISKRGKRVSWGRKRIPGSKKDTKKAILTLKSSDSIDLFKVK
jgi:large subunit ribosomal protein L23